MDIIQIILKILEECFTDPFLIENNKSLFFNWKWVYFLLEYWAWWLYFFCLLMLNSIIFYTLWTLVWVIPWISKLIYNNKNLFYIYLKIIPFLWTFSVFFWALLSSKVNFINNLKKIFIWNILFMLLAFIFAIIKLFAERFEVVKKVGEWKKQNWVTNPLDPKRWKELLEKNILEAEKLWLSSNFVENVWEEIHKESLKIEK